MNTTNPIDQQNDYVTLTTGANTRMALLCSPIGELHHVAGPLVHRFLELGYTFARRQVHIHNDTLKVCKTTLGTTAKQLILNDGWVYGSKYAYRPHRNKPRPCTPAPSAT